MSVSKQIRFLGWVLLLVGLFLVALMGTITYNLTPSLLQPGATVAGGSSFTGTAEQARLVLSLFVVIIGFGLMSIIAGLWQIVTGQRNRWMVIVMLGVFVLVLVTSFATWRGLKG